MAKKKIELPQTIYVYKEHDGKESYLVATETIESCVEEGESILVGKYTLIKTGIVSAETKIVTTL
jgi:hypothetical protein